MPIRIRVPRCEKFLEAITAHVAAGSSLNAAAANHTDIFEHHWVEVIRTGEVTGKMGPVFLELNKQIRDSREPERKVSGALMYPIILILVAIIAMTVMLWLVVPTFAKMFEDMGAELPGITQFVVDASGFVVQYGPYIAVAIGIIVFLFRKYARTEGGQRNLVGIGLVLPMVGELLVQMAAYRFASNISLLLKSGVPMMGTMNTLIGVFHTNPIYRKALTQARSRVASGRPLALAIEETGLFPSMLTNMVKVGEESGQLANVMEQIAPTIKRRWKRLS